MDQPCCALSGPWQAPHLPPSSPLANPSILSLQVLFPAFPKLHPIPTVSLAGFTPLPRAHLQVRCCPGIKQGPASFQGVRIAVASAKERAAGTLRRAGAGPPPHWASPHPRSLAVGPQYSSLGTQPILCASIPGLVPKQLRFCRNYVEIMPSVADGMKISIQECQHQFRGRRWNCTTVNNSLAIFGPVLDKGTRDTLLGPRCTWGAGAGAAAQGLPTLRQELPVSIQLSVSPALSLGVACAAVGRAQRAHSGDVSTPTVLGSPGAPARQLHAHIPPASPSRRGHGTIQGMRDESNHPRAPTGAGPSGRLREEIQKIMFFKHREGRRRGEGRSPLGKSPRALGQRLILGRNRRQGWASVHFW